MDSLLTVALEAHHAERNHHRRYNITIGLDLFGHWTVCIRYGRIGQGSQSCRFGGDNVEAMQRIVHEHLRRRISAPRRIGCKYLLTALDAAPGMDSAPWLPASLLTAFRD